MAPKMYPYGLIGRTIKVVDSPNSALLGLKGKVVDETKSSLRITFNGKTRLLLKGSISFRIIGSNFIINGREIMRRPEERVKGQKRN